MLRSAAGQGVSRSALKDFGKNPNGILLFSPALPDAIGLRRVARFPRNSIVVFPEDHCSRGRGIKRRKHAAPLVFLRLFEESLEKMRAVQRW